MPELPEVEILRRYFEESALQKKIRHVEFLDELNKVYKSTREEIAQNLVNQHFTKTERIGKYFFAKINNHNWLHIHFGMTGTLELFRSEEAPKYSRLIMDFEDGDRLAFCDLRKFGVVRIVDSPSAYQRENKLGADLLRVSLEDFKKGLKNRRVAVKTALLDQKHFAGIGNWIADEMLFETHIHPEKIAADLSDDQLKALHQSVKKILREAIEADTHYGNFPEHFFVNYRKEGAVHPDFPESPVEKLKVGGRGTFIVPQIQKL